MPGGERSCGGNVKDVRSRGAQEAQRGRRHGHGGGAEAALTEELVFRASPPLHCFFSFPLTNYSMRQTELFLRLYDQQTAFQGTAAC